MDLIVSLGKSAAEQAEDLTQQRRLLSQGIHKLLQTNWDRLGRLDRNGTFAPHGLDDAQLTHDIPGLSQVVGDLPSELVGGPGLDDTLQNEKHRTCRVADLIEDLVSLERPSRLHPHEALAQAEYRRECAGGGDECKDRL